MPEQTFTAQRYHYVADHGRWPQYRFYFGLDLGQRQDHSAITAAELTWTHAGKCPYRYEDRYTPWLHIRHLERFPVGTPYEKLYNLVGKVVREIYPRQTYGTPHTKTLVIDASGPGGPVVERLRDNLPNGIEIKPAIITGGNSTNALKDGFTGVPRKTLVSDLQLLLAAESIKCEPDLPGFNTLIEELLELQTGSTQPAASSAHDDLAVATALATWGAIQDASQLLPQTDDSFRRRRIYQQNRLF
ncbi:MAG: hypothetical protein HYX27_19660 [Acidobacteria bacterium]|nr:hypothetical protein [Acidobacteriota bacterium]